MSEPGFAEAFGKVAAICAYSYDDPLLRNPIIGIAVCCARAALHQIFKNSVSQTVPHLLLR
jgi:hypothetical protein